ncbi:hypothetical protein FC699_22505 [Bacillus wiedmannii]|uniref:Uncharacterized protein n=1 Tax=Bacillus wiedmannii TaxID=1890302 RepID=A0A4U3ATL2_9BACI|nr:hypothetical protein FC699_22505 [Bacillus wiedmannii]
MHSTTGSVFYIVQNCPVKWIYVWLTQAPQGQPTEFWLKVEHLDEKTIAGERIYTKEGKKFKDKAVIDLINISQIVCYDPKLEGGQNSDTTGGQTTCAGGSTGNKIDSQSFDLEVFNVKYDVFECQIVVKIYAFGIKVYEYTLKKGQNSLEFKYEQWPYLYKIVMWVENKTLKTRLEIRDRILGGTSNFGPWDIASWNSLAF